MTCLLCALFYGDLCQSPDASCLMCSLLLSSFVLKMKAIYLFGILLPIKLELVTTADEMK